MSLHEEIIANLSGFSKAMYSTWFFYRPARILLDAGEGVSTAMENFVFGIEKVFLSHGHYDHIGGLPGLLQSRRSARGDNEKPLEVYYPLSDELISLQRRYIENLTYTLGYRLTWHPIEPAQRVPLGAGRDRGFLVPFRVQHAARSVSLGFNIMEERMRLRPEFAALSEAELAALARTRPVARGSATMDAMALHITDDAAADDDTHDLVRSFQDLVHARVAQQALQRVFADVAVAAVQLQGLVHHGKACIGGKALGHGAVGGGVARPGIELAGGQAHHLAGGDQLGSHVGQLELNGLQSGYRFPKLHPLLGIGYRHLIGSLGDSY